MRVIPLAVAGAVPLGALDASGYIHFDDGGRVEWWVLGDDYWHVPAASPSLRQRAIDNTPIVETVVRVPGGDVAWRAGAVATSTGASLVVECENRATIPVAVGVARVDATGHVDLAVHPVTHTTTWRGALVGDTPSDDLQSAAKGWLALANHGAQIDLGDPALVDALTAAHTSLLVHQGALVARGRAADKSIAGAVASALTLLGHEDEAEALRLSARVKPARRGLPLVDPLTDAPLTTDALALLAEPRRAANTVAHIRALVVDDAQRKALDVLPGFEPSWQGRSVDVRDLPTPDGVLSFSLRWHGEKPALLWDGPRPVTARAVAPTWSSAESKGDALLSPAR